MILRLSKYKWWWLGLTSALKLLSITQTKYWLLTTDCLDNIHFVLLHLHQSYRGHAGRLRPTPPQKNRKRPIGINQDFAPDHHYMQHWGFQPRFNSSPVHPQRREHIPILHLPFYGLYHSLHPFWHEASTSGLEEQAPERRGWSTNHEEKTYCLLHSILYYLLHDIDMGLFGYLTLTYFFSFDGWMIVFQNLIYLPQIVHNIRRGNSPGFYASYVLGYLGLRMLIPLY